MAQDYISDKRWMYVHPQERVEDIFVDGVKYFTKFALEHTSKGSGQIPCPCKSCENKYWRDKDTVEFHIVKYGFVRDYTCWHFYGESQKEFREEDSAVLASEEIHSSANAGGWSSDMSNEHQSSGTLAPAAVGVVSRRKRGRGVNKMDSALPPKGTKWMCRWEGGLPIGDAGGKLASTLGVYARMGNYFPLHMEWGLQHKRSWEKVWSELQNYYNWEGPEDPDNPGKRLSADLEIVRRWCKESLQKKVRDWRSRVKRDYYDFWVDATPEERQGIKRDSRLCDNDWTLLVEYFEQDKKKVEIARNTINRGKSRVIHTTGSRSMMRAKEKWQEAMGESYTTLTGYLMAHKRQKGTGDYPDEQTRAFCEAVSQKSHELCLTQSKEPSVLSPALDAVFHGHHGGHERGVGVGYSRRLMRESIDVHSRNEPTNHLQQAIDNIKAQQNEISKRLLNFERIMEEMIWKEKKGLLNTSGGQDKSEEVEQVHQEG